MLVSLLLQYKDLVHLSFHQVTCAYYNSIIREALSTHLVHHLMVSINGGEEDAKNVNSNTLFK